MAGLGDAADEIRSGQCALRRLGFVRKGTAQARVEARQPGDDLVPGQSGVADLAVLLAALARGEDARGHRAGADQLAHRAMDPVDVEQMVLLALGEQHILRDLVQEPSRDCREIAQGNRTASWCR